MPTLTKGKHILCPWYTRHQSIQYLEAVRRLKKSGFQPKRTVHVTFAPDEEVGGANGVQLLVKTPEFKAMNVGFALDEGGNSKKKTFQLCFTERKETGKLLCIVRATRTWLFAIR